MSILHSRFDPTHALLATVQVALDAHQLQVQSVVSSQSSVSSTLTLDRKVRVTGISWTPYEQTFAVAVCTTKGTIQIYSPHQNKVVMELTTPSGLAVTDFHFCQYTQSGFASDVGGSIFEWNLNSGKLVGSFKVADVLPTPEPIVRISSGVASGVPHLFLASHSLYMVNCATKQLVQTFPGHVEPINRLEVVSDDMVLTAAHGDRFINLYSISKRTTAQVFVASRSVADIEWGKDENHSVLVAIGEDGVMEVFNEFLNAEVVTAPTKKKRRQAASVVSRQGSATIKLTRPQTEISSPADAQLPVVAAAVVGPTILYSWMESATLPYFDRVKWVDEGHAVLDSAKVIERAKPVMVETAHEAKGHDIAASKFYSEAHAVISDGNNLRDVENASDDEEGESMAEKLEKLHPQEKKQKPARLGGKNAATLTIMLSQSLRNNDHSLLEVVLGNRDKDVIKNTIAKLDSSLAVALLDRLSERIQRQATKFDQLNFWLKWIIIIHGAVLASMPNLATKLSNLHSILIKKADTLPRLMELQGRLTLLYHQQSLKREILQDDDDAAEGIESDVEYIEALDDASDDDFDMEVDDFEEIEAMEDNEVEDEDIEADEAEEEEDGYSDAEAE